MKVQQLYFARYTVMVMGHGSWVMGNGTGTGTGSGISGSGSGSSSSTIFGIVLL